MVILAIQFKRIYTRDVWYWLARELRLREYERLELLQSGPAREHGEGLELAGYLPCLPQRQWVLILLRTAGHWYHLRP